MATLTTENATEDTTSNTDEKRAFLSKYNYGGLSEERSLLLTFVLFALILSIAGLATVGLALEDGSGSITNVVNSTQSLITPGI